MPHALAPLAPGLGRMAEDAPVSRSLKSLIKDHSLDDWADSFVRLGEGGDRSLAILATAMVERGLQNAIIQRMVKLTKSEHDQLFDGTGPLSSFSSKIKIAYSIGAISGSARADLDSIREIRNAFAHSIVYIDFTEPAISDRCRQLWLGRHLEELEGIDPSSSVLLSTARIQFQYNARMYSSILFAYGSNGGGFPPSPDRPAL
jgi:DNA-binding MltR family transcriptional regulator